MDKLLDKILKTWIIASTLLLAGVCYMAYVHGIYLVWLMPVAIYVGWITISGLVIGLIYTVWTD